MELDEPELFAGRAAQIEQLCRDLHTDGVCPVIYGDPGLGKSSLALQIWRIAQGDKRLLSQHGLRPLAFSLDECFLAFYIPCTDATPTIDALLHRVVISLNSLTLENDPQVLVDTTTRRSVSLKVFTREKTKKYERMTRRQPNVGVEDTLSRTCSLLSEISGQRVLIVVDELDRLVDAHGLSSFMKAYSSASLRIMLVGSARTVSDLLDDHGSVQRLTDPVLVDRMVEPELRAIVERATQRLSREGIALQFDDDAASELVDLSSGFPWFVHVIGEEAILGVDKDERTNVTVTDVRRATESLTRNRFAQQFSDLYRRAVRGSYQREQILRGFAECRERDIRTVDAYRAFRRLGVANPSAYKGQLASAQYGRVLQASNSQDRGVVRFSNEMFKVYVRLRPSLNEGLATKVRTMFNESRPRP
jgi:Cdc6-like AAA superfamily ATPase